MINNQKVIAKINNHLILNAKVYKAIYKNTPTKYFLCHNDPNCIGSDSPDKLGYKYSWIFYEYKYSNKKYTDDVQIYIGDTKEFTINEDLINFIQIENIQILYLFILKTGRFQNYDSLSFNKQGLILINSSVLNKTIEMKIGRFIKTLIEDNINLENPDFFDYKNLSNSNLEDISNRFKKFINKEHIYLEIVKNEDILKGYNKNNYYEGNKANLSSSCMTDKFEFLEIYTKNSNVELAILYFKEKIIARCLVWNTNKGKYHDKIYSNTDWAFKTLSNSLENMGIKMINSEKQYIIDLKYIPEYFPYVDNMRYLDPHKKQLTNIRNKNRFNRYLTFQNGQYDQLSNTVIEKFIINLKKIFL
jgi:hypothetical protein